MSIANGAYVRSARRAFVEDLQASGTARRADLDDRVSVSPKFVAQRDLNVDGGDRNPSFALTPPAGVAVDPFMTATTKRAIFDLLVGSHSGVARTYDTEIYTSYSATEKEQTVRPVFNQLIEFKWVRGTHDIDLTDLGFLDQLTWTGAFPAGAWDPPTSGLEANSGVAIQIRALGTFNRRSKGFIWGPDGPVAGVQTLDCPGAGCAHGGGPLTRDYLLGFASNGKAILTPAEYASGNAQATWHGETTSPDADFVSYGTPIVAEVCCWSDAHHLYRLGNGDLLEIGRGQGSPDQHRVYTSNLEPPYTVWVDGEVSRTYYWPVLHIHGPFNPPG